jgi:aarF domain-containing kinase
MYTPLTQSTLSTELGTDWRDKFKDFEHIPFAAASIGQVHRATLISGQRVAVKVQYPGVQTSILSDLDNVRTFLSLGSLLPKGLYLDNTIRVAKIELQMECDYTREADSMKRFSDLLLDRNLSDAFVVPRVYRELSTSRVLTAEFVDGFPIGEAVNCDQTTKDKVI